MSRQKVLASQLELGLRVLARQSQDAQTGTISLLGIATGLQEGAEIGGRMGTYFFGFPLEPIAIGVHDKLMIGRHVFGSGGKATLHPAARVRATCWP